MAEGGRHDVAIDIAATSLQKMMSDHHLLMSSQCCIFKVPNILYRHNPKAYVPDAFSIGPFHYGKPELKATEIIKIKYLQSLINRLQRPSASVKDFTEAIRMVENDARSCYARPPALDVDEFVQVMVLDACFIIELFRKYHDVNLRDKDDPIFNMSCMLQFLYHDLILLENQIPWLVLECLFNMTSTSNPEGMPSLVELAIIFFKYIFSSNPLLPYKNHETLHILDLLRNSLILSAAPPVENHELISWKSIPSATSLKEAGIKFKKGETNCILDIKFRDGVLEIPPLLIQETTEVIFRNLISYEQCYPNCDARITSYAILLDNFINTEKDIELLCGHKIIENWLNPEDATRYFNKLYHDTYINEYYYSGIHAQVNNYCQRCWPRNRGVLMRNYFNTPWAFLSTMAAIILLILTFLQTLFGIIK